MRALFAKGAAQSSVLRKLDARTKLIVTATTAVLTVASSGMVSQLVLFAVTLVYVLLLKRPGLVAVLYVLMAAMMAIAALCALGFQLWMPGLGGLSAKMLLIPFLRGLSMMNVVMVLALTTRVEDLLLTLERMKPLPTTSNRFGKPFALRAGRWGRRCSRCTQFSQLA